MDFFEVALALGYSIEEEPFVDGLDTVYRATHTESGDMVALRLVPPGFDSERFAREADVLATLEHPGIINLREHRQVSGWSLLVLDWIEGETLEVFMVRRGAVSVDEAMHVVEQLGAALDTLHSAGIVHPHLTPRSVVALAGSGPRPTVKLIDLAISRGETNNAVENNTVENNTVANEPGAEVDESHEITATSKQWSYGAPEVAAGGQRVPETDQYLTAAILHELLTGSSPVAPNSDRATPIRKIRPSFSQDLERALLRALSPDPSDRFPTMSAFLAAARAAPKGAAPEPDNSRAKKSTKSKRSRGERGEAKSSGGFGRSDSLKALAAVALGVFIGVVGFLVFFAGDDVGTREVSAPTNSIETDGIADSDESLAQRGLEVGDAGFAASVACNAVTNPDFETPDLPENFYSDPRNIGREQVVAGSGVGLTGALEIGDPGVAGDYGELLPIEGGVEYFFSLNSSIAGDVVESSVTVEWLDEAQQFIEQSSELNLVGRPDGQHLLIAGASPDTAAFGVPRIHKGDGVGLLFVDELVFARTDADCASGILG